MASTRAAISSPPPAAFRPTLSQSAICAGAPSCRASMFSAFPSRGVPSRSQGLAAYCSGTCGVPSLRSPLAGRCRAVWGSPSFGKDNLFKCRKFVNKEFTKVYFYRIKKSRRESSVRWCPLPPVRRRRAGRRPKRRMAALSSRAETGLT